MPLFDQVCQARCGWLDEIRVPSHEHPPCPSCGGSTERIFLGGYGFEGDEFVGGKWIENLGPEPVLVESKSHLKREMEIRGLDSRVRHIGVNGTDKNPHTSRWV